jgi:hypothetical protein
MFGKMQRGGNFLKHRKFFKNSENAPSYSNYFLKSVENLFSLWWGRGEGGEECNSPPYSTSPVVSTTGFS